MIKSGVTQEGKVMLHYEISPEVCFMGQAAVVGGTKAEARATCV